MNPPDVASRATLLLPLSYSVLAPESIELPCAPAAWEASAPPAPFVLSPLLGMSLSTAAAIGTDSSALLAATCCPMVVAVGSGGVAGVGCSGGGSEVVEKVRSRVAKAPRQGSGNLVNYRGGG